MTSCWDRRVRVRFFFLLVITLPLCSSALAFPLRSEGATIKFFLERYRMLAKRLLFCARPQSSRPKCRLRRLPLLLLLVRSRLAPISYKLCATPTMLACLLRRWCLALQTVRTGLRRIVGRCGSSELRG